MSTTYQREVYIVDGARTPFLKERKKLGPFSASDLAVQAGRALLARQPFEASALGEVVIGSALASPKEANIGRVISQRLGCGDAVTAWTVQRNCASGLQALDTAAKDIACGRHDLVLAGGCDAMSQAPLMFGAKMVNWLGAFMRARSVGARAQLVTRLRPAYFAPVIALMQGLTDHQIGQMMGHTAEEVAYHFKLTRELIDKYALESHLRLADAIDNGRMNEVVPIIDNQGNLYATDDGVRRDSSMEKIGKSKPFFDRRYGMVTPANSSQITDGAALLLLASKEAVSKYNLPVLARINDCQWAGLNPAEMGLGPVHATAPLLSRSNLSMQDIDYWEINEAFSAQVLGCLSAFDDKDYCSEELKLSNALGQIDESKLNVDGGAIALGHPIGATGARLVLHLANTLKQKQARYGVATLCIGGGQGGAMLIEAMNGGI